MIISLHAEQANLTFIVKFISFISNIVNIFQGLLHCCDHCITKYVSNKMKVLYGLWTLKVYKSINIEKANVLGPDKLVYE